MPNVLQSINGLVRFFSQYERHVMKKTPKRSTILLAAALLPMGLMTAVFALCGLTPFGSRSLGVLDMSSQYLSFLGSLRDLVSGRASALYLPSMALGGSMAGVMAYYLVSPLNLIVCLFPKQSLLTAVSVLYILRVGLCGLTMAIYAGARHGWSRRVLLPSLAYGFMGYMLAYSINYQWQDCVILLPLVALGIARLVEGRGWRLYAFTLAAALALNFYTGYILCLFSALFFLYELLTGPGVRSWRTVGVFALASLAAGAMAAAVLVPAFFSLMGGKAGFSLSDLSLAVKFPFTALFSKLLAGSFNYDELTPEGLPNIFCGAVTLAMAALYFANDRVPRRRRLGTGLLLGALVLSFWVSALDLVWHGMNVPAWYNYRYSFLFSFLLIAAGDREAALFREGTRPWHLALPVAAAGLIAVLALTGPAKELVTPFAGIWSVGLTAALCGGLYILLRPGSGTRLAAGLGAAALLVHMADLGLNAKLSLTALTAASSDPAKWAAYVTEKSAALDLIDTGDALTRVESPDIFDQNRCEPMLFGYDGLSHYSSNIPQKNLAFLQRLGVPCYKGLFALYGPDVTAGADSLLAVRYLAASRLNKPYQATASDRAYTVWENPYVLPVGWTADGAIAESVAASDPFGYIQGLYDAAAPEVDAAIYAPAGAELTTEGMTDAGDGRYALDGGLSGALVYTVTPTADGPLYGFIDIRDYPGVLVYVDDQYLAYYATGQTNGTLYLGDLAAGDTVTVRVQAAGDLTVAGAAFATENAAALADYQAAMADGACVPRKLSPSHFTASFTAGEDDPLLVLTIPWDSGWRVALDGKTVQPLEVQDCLMAIPVTAGEHTLDMRYAPPGLLPGACVSAGALAVCLFLALRKRR